MKIVHVVESFAGGVFQFLVTLTAGLTDVEHVIIYGTREDTPPDFCKFFAGNVTFLPWQHVQRKIHISADGHAAIELYRILRQLGNIDVLHLHSSKAGFIGRIVARILSLSGRTIYTPHGLSFVMATIPAWKKWLYKALEQIAARAGGQAIACSLSEKTALMDIGIPASFINNGVARPATVYAAKSPAAVVTIATVGRITLQKNPALFNQLALAFQKNPAVRFLWIGDGELRSLLTSANIEITGWIEQQVVMEILEDVDIYVSTALWEGLSLAVLQAMAMSKPLVLSNCIGNCDLVQHGTNGYLYDDVQNGIAYLEGLVRDGEQRVKMARASRQLLETSFSLEQMLGQYKERYGQLVNQRYIEKAKNPKRG